MRTVFYADLSAHLQAQENGNTLIIMTLFIRLTTSSLSIFLLRSAIVCQAAFNTGNVHNSGFSVEWLPIMHARSRLDLARASNDERPQLVTVILSANQKVTLPLRRPARGDRRQHLPNLRSHYTTHIDVLFRNKGKYATSKCYNLHAYKVVKTGHLDESCYVNCAGI